MKQPDVLYSIEHVGRELAIACAVRHLAREKYGVDVEVISLPHHAREATRQYRPRLVVVPSFLSRRGYGANSHLERFRGIPIFNIAMEQLLSQSNRMFRMPKDRVAREEVLHAAAGDFYRKWLLASGVPARNIAMIGSLPCQLYRAPYCAFFQGARDSLAAKHGLDLRKPWVLFPENFAAAFFTRSHIRHRLRHGYDRRELMEYVEFSRNSFRETMRWCAAAACERQVEIIVRPRPAMPEESFVAAARSVMKGLPTSNLHFIKEGDLRSWVLASQTVVSTFSTVLLEASAAGKPTLLLKPYSIPASASSAWHASARCVHSRAEFLDATSHAATPDLDIALRQWVERTLLAQGDAIANLARTLAEVVHGQRYVPHLRRPGLATIAWDKFRDGCKQGERRARTLFRPARRATFDHATDDFDASDVDKVTRRWEKFLPGNKSARAA